LINASRLLDHIFHSAKKLYQEKNEPLPPWQVDLPAVVSSGQWFAEVC